VTVLAITTTTPRCSVALLSAASPFEAAVLAMDGYEDGMAHAERLFGVVDRVMASAALERAAIRAIACDVGPGSFTGVRVGLAAAKGMALALAVPLWPVGSLATMAAAAFADERAANLERMACLLDAKRGELFVAVVGRDGAPIEPCKHVALDQVEPWLATLREDDACGFVGRATEGLELPGARVFRDDACELPRADWLARLALQAAAATEPPELAAVEPVYVRGPDAKVQVTEPPRPLPRG
jgi:tRNA threonylcarbamoyladenosine biosynthesis protein TsaB